MVLPLVLPVEPVEPVLPVPYGLVLVPDGDGLVSVPVAPGELGPVELLPEYGEVPEGLDPVVPVELLPVLLVSLLLPVEPMPVELLPVSLLLPVESVPVEVLPVVSELLPVPPIVDDPLVAAPPPVAVLGAEEVLSAPFPAPPTVDEGPVPVVEVPEEPVPIELGSLVVELEEPLP